MAVEPTPGVQLWTAEEDLFIVSQLCFLPKPDWSQVLIAYTDRARELPKVYTKARRLSTLASDCFECFVMVSTVYFNTEANYTVNA
jgi:hypothetical protein